MVVAFTLHCHANIPVELRVGWSTTKPSDSCIIYKDTLFEILLLLFLSLLIFFSHVVPQLADVNDSSLVCSAVLSPMSHSTALLTILQPGVTQANTVLTAENIAPATTDTSADLPDVVSSVLGVVYDIMEEDGDGVDGKVQSSYCRYISRQKCQTRFEKPSPLHSFSTINY